MRQSRRHLLKALAVSGLVVPLCPGLLSAQARTKVRVQIGWIPNVQYAGEWIALKRGLLAERGLDVEWYPGGPNALPSPVMLAAGKADLGYSTWFPFLDAVAQGNDLVMIAAVFPKNPLGIISLAKKPILEPKDLVGKRILAQGANEKTAIEATLSLAGLPIQWTQVPAGFSPEPLLAGDGDGYTAFGTNQTIILERMGLVWGKDFHFVSFDELGFRTYGAVLITTRAYLENHRPLVIAYLRGIIAGWNQNEADPSVAARLAVETFGADLGLELAQQTRQNELQIPLTRYEGTDRPRLALDREVITGPMYKAARATGRNNLPDVDRIADFTIVSEAHQGL
ncbi:ABC transporter substrate-binding protein [Microvirga brassicacearum]|uniref:ABC transporter substrate-binding protein n=1 Tax=Microvirga brassicacearum TaxID=2580413 RepID=A0A5N3PEC0_9HYPH|nr:ABC transporter substrate-binding protein [Microvirga brassicacearum]KAB0268061.1 ABC transporter substrate-binding protein [Microvirga brassicacearum]